MFAAESGQATEVRSRFFRIFRPGRHGHEPSQTQVCAPFNRFDQRRQFLWRRALLRLFPGQLHLDHYLYRLATGIQAPRELRGIHGLNDSEQLRCPLGLVRLQMPDEMKRRVRQVLQSWIFLVELLHVIFAELPHPELVSLAHHARGKLLRYGNQCNLLTAPPGALGCLLNAPLHLLPTFPQHSYYNKIHVRPAAGKASRGNPEEAQLAIERFLKASRQPILFEAGEESVPLHRNTRTTERDGCVPNPSEDATPSGALSGDNFAVTMRGATLTLEAWSGSRNLVRRITGIRDERRGRLELTVERFGKRSGTLLLVDAAAPRNHALDRRSGRLEFRELFRRSLYRQFPGYRIQELSSDPDLEHSLSPVYPRALLRQGATAWAAIGAGPDRVDASGILSFGLIWLDYLRRRDHRVAIEGLALFLPEGQERTTCLRLRWLDPRAARYAVFVYADDGYEQLIDERDFGNLSTHLETFHSPLAAAPPHLLDLVERLTALPGVDRVDGPEGSVTLRVRGLPFARTEGGELLVGLEAQHAAGESNFPEIERLVSEIARLRAPDAADRNHSLLTRHPEAWLESQVRAHIEELDAALLPEPIYGQVPAIAGVERGVIDLVACERTGRLVILELKASQDIHLPLQALDYWMRVKWHLDRDEFGARGYFPGIALRRQSPRMLLVAPALEFHPSNEVVLRYLSPEVAVECIGIGIEWQRELKVMFRHPSRVS